MKGYNYENLYNFENIKILRARNCSRLLQCNLP